MVTIATRLKIAKEDAWKEMPKKVKGANTSEKSRLTMECKKKWFDLRLENMERSKTGVGTSDEIELSAVDQVVPGFFVEEELQGIQGIESRNGSDTLRTKMNQRRYVCMHVCLHAHLISLRIVS